MVTHWRPFQQIRNASYYNADLAGLSEEEAEVR